MQATSTAATPNFSHSTNRNRRRVASPAVTTASRAKKPHSIRPSVKPPCRLAHNSIASSSNGFGARPCSLARTRPATHSTRNGKAKTCGRARKCGPLSTIAATVNNSAGSGRRSRSSRRSIRAKVAASEAAESAATAPHPPPRSANANRICESHSFAIHGWPVKVCEWLSTCGTAPFSRIHLPMATCQRLSGSASKGRPVALRSRTNKLMPTISGHETRHGDARFPSDERRRRAASAGENTEGEVVVICSTLARGRPMLPLQLVADGGEGVGELAAQGLGCGDHDGGDQAGDESVLEGGGAGVVADEA